MRIEDMSAGREMDALVAEVMGWEQRYMPDSVPMANSPEFLYPPPDRWGFYPEEPERIPAYSTDIAAAWQVVEKMRGNDITIRIWKNRTQYVTIDTPSDHSSTVANDSIPLAICRAALLACGVKDT